MWYSDQADPKNSLLYKTGLLIFTLQATQAAHYPLKYNNPLENTPKTPLPF